MAYPLICQCDELHLQISKIKSLSGGLAGSVGGTWDAWSQGLSLSPTLGAPTLAEIAFIFK